MKHNYDDNIKNCVELDLNYNSLVKEFLKVKKYKLKKEKVIYCLSELYNDLIRDKKLISNKDSTLIIKKIKLQNILEFQGQIEEKVNSKVISKERGQELLFITANFLKFLSNKNLVKVLYKPLNLIEKKTNNLKREYSLILLEFEQYLYQHIYAHTYNYLNYAENYLEFSNYNVGDEHNNNFLKENIIKYEELLQSKVIKELLAPTTAYQNLSHLKVFFKFLYKEKKSQFIYTVPQKMRHHSNRTNEYVNVRDIQLVINTIIETSNDALRDLTIFLLLVETGCRPIEVANLTTSDILVRERIIKLNSIKSKQRTLKLSMALSNLLSDYINIRKNYTPKNNTQAFYLNSIGNPINTKTITKFIRKYNLKTFDEIRFSAKTCRHTFITNALNNKNDIKYIAEAVGHQHVKSTLYYYYRDLNSIKVIGQKNILDWLEES